MSGLRETMYKSSICQRIGKIIEEDFTNVTLITLYCSSAATMPLHLAKGSFRSWVYRARRIAGEQFKYIRIVDYSMNPVQMNAFYVVSDLPINICRAACGEWCIGEASAAPLDKNGIDRIAQAVVHRPDLLNAHAWSYCKGARERRTRFLGTCSHDDGKPA